MRFDSLSWDSIRKKSLKERKKEDAQNEEKKRNEQKPYLTTWININNRMQKMNFSKQKIGNKKKQKIK